MKKQTQIFIYNENGFINSESLSHFSLDYMQKSMFDFNVKWKSEIDPLSTIFSKLYEEELELITYDYGYVLKIEGSIIKTILFLRDLDNYLNQDIVFYISPTQILENNIERLYVRGSKLMEIALFLDKVFLNNLYSKEISNL
jgi:hypothetical protein